MQFRQQIFTEGIDNRLTSERGNPAALLELSNARILKRGETGYIVSIDGYEVEQTFSPSAEIVSIAKWRDKLITLLDNGNDSFTLKIYGVSPFAEEESFDYVSTSSNVNPKIVATEDAIFIASHNVMFNYLGGSWNQNPFRSTTPTFDVYSTATGTKATGTLAFIQGTSPLRVATARVDAEYRVNVPTQLTGAIPDGSVDYSFEIEGIHLSNYTYVGSRPTATQITDDIYNELTGDTDVTDVFTVTKSTSTRITLVAKSTLQGDAGNGILFYTSFPDVSITQITVGADAIAGEAGPNKTDTIDITTTHPVLGALSYSVVVAPSLSATAVRDLVYTAMNTAPLNTRYTLLKTAIYGVPYITFEALAIGTNDNSTLAVDVNTTDAVISPLGLLGGASSPGSSAGTLLVNKTYSYTARYVYADGHTTKTAYPKFIKIQSDQSAYLSIPAVVDIDGGYANIEIFRRYEGGNFFKIETVTPTAAGNYIYVDKGEVEISELDEQNYVWVDYDETQEIVRDRLVKANVEYRDVTFPAALASLITVTKNETAISNDATILPRNTKADIYAQARYNDGTDTLFKKITTIETDSDDAKLDVAFGAGIQNYDLKEIALYARYRKNFGDSNTHKFKSIEIANKNIPFIYSDSTYPNTHPYYDLDEIKPLNPHIFLGWKYITVYSNGGIDEVRVYDGEWDTSTTGFDAEDDTKYYWVIDDDYSGFTGQDFLYLDYTAPASSYSSTFTTSGFTFSSTPPTNAFFSNYKLKYKFGTSWYVYELACTDAIKIAAREGKMSIKIDSTTSYISDTVPSQRYTTEYVPVLYVEDTTEASSVPTIDKSGAPSVTDKVYGPLKNHVYLVLPTGTIYDDIADRAINQNTYSGQGGQGVVANYRTATSQLFIQNNAITFSVGYLKDTTPSPTTPTDTSVDGYTLRDTDYAVTSTSDIPFTELSGAVYLGTFPPLENASLTIGDYGFTKRTLNNFTYGELNRYNIYKTLVTEEDLRSIKTDYPNQLIWSEPIVIGTNVSKARTFTFNNFKLISSDHGEIVDIRFKDNVLYAFCERGVCAITIGEILTSQSGQNVLIDSSRFLNTDIWVFKNLKNVSKLSVAEGDNTLFFSDGFDVWMHDSNWKNINNGKIVVGEVLGATYDTLNKEYKLNTTAGVYCYSVEGQAWMGAHTYDLVGGVNIGQQLYEFSNDTQPQIRKQNSTTTFGGSAFTTEVAFRMNVADEPDTAKTWRKLSIEGSNLGTITYSKATTGTVVTTSKAMNSYPIYDNTYQVGLNDIVNNATAIKVSLASNATMTLKNIVYHFDYRRRR